VEFGTVAKGETMPVEVLLSNTKVTVCGSATVDGLSQVILWPTLTCACCGTNTANISVEFPPPACALISVDVLLLLLLSIALIALTFAVNITSANAAAITAIIASIDFIVIGARDASRKYMGYDEN